MKKFDWILRRFEAPADEGAWCLYWFVFWYGVGTEILRQEFEFSHPSAVKRSPTNTEGG